MKKADITKELKALKKRVEELEKNPYPLGSYYPTIVWPEPPTTPHFYPNTTNPPYPNTNPWWEINFPGTLPGTPTWVSANVNPNDTYYWDIGHGGYY